MAAHGTATAIKGASCAGGTLGLVGFGRIARRVAVLGRCFGMPILALPRMPGTIDPALAEEAASLEALLAAADVVSLHAPLTQATRGMIGRTTLPLMKPGRAACEHGTRRAGRRGGAGGGAGRRAGSPAPASTTWPTSRRVRIARCSARRT